MRRLSQMIADITLPINPTTSQTPTTSLLNLTASGMNCWNSSDPG